MKKSIFQKANGIKMRNLMVLPLFFAFLLSGVSLSAQATSSPAEKGLVGSDAEEFALNVESMLNDLENRQFVNPAQAASLLENRFVEIDELFAGGNLSASQEVYQAISQEFSKHLYVDVLDGQSVKSAFENNVDNLINAFGNFGGHNYSIDIKEIFDDSVILLTR